MRYVLAERNVKSVFQFLHQRGWSWGAIAQATDIGEQRVREIANGKRRVENYDVYVRVAVGLNIPREYLGVGLNVPNNGVTLADPMAARQTAPPPELAATLRTALEIVTPTRVADHDQRDPQRFEEKIIQASASRGHAAQRDTSLVLVAGFAGSGKTEFAKFLSAITGWALLDKDTLTRPLVESILTALNGDPNDRHSEIYKTRVRPIEYRCLNGATFANIDNGTSTVVTAPFLAEVVDRRWLDRLAFRCTSAGADFEIVWVGADIETMYTNLQQRDAARDTWKLNHWDEYVASIDLTIRPRFTHLYVDNSVNRAVRRIIEATTMSGSAAISAGATPSTPAVRAPLLPRTRSHATVRKSG